MRSMAPQQQREHKTDMRASKMPEIYGHKNQMVKRVGKIMLAQFTACRRLLAKCASDGTEPTFDKLNRYNSERDGV